MKDLAASILAHIAPSPRFTEMDRDDALQLLQTCQAVHFGEFAVGDVFSVLNRLHHDGEFPHWLAAIRQAIIDAKMTRADRAGLRAAFEMATVILFDARERRGLRAHR